MTTTILIHLDLSVEETRELIADLKEIISDVIWVAEL
jgi:hypothetical protein